MLPLSKPSADDTQNSIYMFTQEDKSLIYHIGLSLLDYTQNLDKRFSLLLASPIRRELINRSQIAKSHETSAKNSSMDNSNVLLNILYKTYFNGRERATEGLRIVTNLQMEIEEFKNRSSDPKMQEGLKELEETCAKAKTYFKRVKLKSTLSLAINIVTVVSALFVAMGSVISLSVFPLFMLTVGLGLVAYGSKQFFVQSTKKNALNVLPASLPWGYIPALDLAGKREGSFFTHPSTKPALV